MVLTNHAHSFTTVNTKIRTLFKYILYYYIISLIIDNRIYNHHLKDKIKVLIELNIYNYNENK